ncbi:MAG TPA: response regulator transcription factor [Burkholderiales bacterium]|nr:response regulator transcription factor [Burkholderiales bacterium]
MTLFEQSFTELSRDADGIQHPEANLSTRERSVVHLMSNGLSNKEIARHLCIAPETVKSHAKNIFWKLTVRSRAQAVYRAAALGLI